MGDPNRETMLSSVISRINLVVEAYQKDNSDQSLLVRVQGIQGELESLGITVRELGIGEDKVKIFEKLRQQFNFIDVE